MIELYGTPPTACCWIPASKGARFKHIECRERENMANWDGEHCGAAAVAAHGHSRIRDLRDTFLSDDCSCTR